MEAADLTGFDLSEAIWKKSSLSGGSGGNCVEVAGNLPGAVAVRDSKNPAGPVLVLASSGWHIFLDAVKSGHFN
ncbi:DUF397 domain-containing protein [Streptosporangium sp. NPDC002721]|uniref:DUF397 domain-containing protein n=1 Tax=Streptosporangium sp. NPDC002721 TaxID=3366188 RepID=UPI0036C25771